MPAMPEVISSPVGLSRFDGGGQLYEADLERVRYLAHGRPCGARLRELDARK